jgi:cytoskeletal protein RodZ
MPTVSEQLRHAREEQKLTIHQVAEITKIKTDHLRALEMGEYDLFSATVYIRGFVRTYATMLKLDIAQISADLEAELSHSPKFREPPPLTPRPQTPLDLLMFQASRMNWRVALAVAVVAIVAVFAVVAFQGKAHQKEGEYLKKLGSGLYQPKRDQSGELLPLPTNSPRRPQ